MTARILDRETPHAQEHRENKAVALACHLNATYQLDAALIARLPSQEAKWWELRAKEVGVNTPSCLTIQRVCELLSDQLARRGPKLSDAEFFSKNFGGD